MEFSQLSFISARDGDDVHLMTKFVLRMIKHIVLHSQKNFGVQEIISAHSWKNFCEREIARDLKIFVFEFYSLRKTLPEHQNLD